MKLRERFRRLTFWNKLAALGALASIIGLPVGLYTFLSRQGAPDSQKKQVSIYKPDPTPAEILRDIFSRPPFQRPQAGQQYVGLNVSWQVRLEGVDEGVLWLIADEDSVVTCRIDIEEYPRLKSAAAGFEMRIEGTIEAVRGHGPLITLGECSVFL